MKKCCDKIRKLHTNYASFMEKYASSILLLTIRIFIGLIFYKSGMVKLSNMKSTIYLFQYDYALPYINPVFAAYSAMIFEIGCSVLLFAGLFTRVAVLPLIGMALVIQIFVEQNQDHFYWLFLLSTLAVYGAGKISVEGIFCKFCKK